MLNRTECPSAEEFIETLRRSNQRWWSDDSSLNCEWVFRGQFDADWPLLPSAWRTPNPLNDLRSRIEALPRQKPGDRWPNHAAFDVQSNVEIEALSQFARLAQDLRFRIDEDIESPLQRNSLFTQSTHISGCCLKPPRCAAIAQHHGIPTRLLDWTRDPIHAAYFAVAHCFRPLDHEPEQVSVWALHIEKLGSYGFGNCQLERMSIPGHIDDFIHAQKGLFTYVDDVEKHLLEQMHRDESTIRWPSLNSLFKKSLTPERLQQITVPFYEADKVLFLLDREGISRAHLMPTLDHVADTLFDRWKNAFGV